VVLGEVREAVKAVVLAGGQGTRRRPRTETVKKELLPLVDRAILHHSLDRLVRHGVDEVIMSSPYLEESFEPFIAERAGSPSIVWVSESVPLDTGGAIVQALDRVGGEAFLAMNGDVITDLDVTAMLHAHRERGAVATIALHHTDDARPFGLVMTEADGRVTEFREKPADLVPGDINAGTYVLEPTAIDRYPRGEPLSIERVVFPELIGSGGLVRGFPSGAYWMDLGTPEKYLQANFDALSGKLATLQYPAPFLHESALVDPGARVGRLTVVGPACSIGSDADVDSTVLHPEARVMPGGRVRGSILGRRAVVGEGASVTECVLGEGAIVPPGLEIESARVSPFSEAPAPA